MMPKMCLAKALYDNEPDSSDELSFRRGDILTVVELCPEGLEGWWVCELRDKRGIVPGNRLRVIAGSALCEKDAGRGGTMDAPHTTHPQHGNASATVQLRTRAQDNVYEVSPGERRAAPLHGVTPLQGAAPPTVRMMSTGVVDSMVGLQPGATIGDGAMEDGNWKRRSWHTNPDQVVTPNKVGDVYVYDQPNKLSADYDVPPSRYFPGAPAPYQYHHHHHYPHAVSNELYGTSIPPGATITTHPLTHHPPTRNDVTSSPSAIYDTPPPPQPTMSATPASSVCSLSSKDSASCHNGSISGGVEDLYDVPPSHPISVHADRLSVASSSAASSTHGSSSGSRSSFTRSTRSCTELCPQELYDVPPASKPVKVLSVTHHQLQQQQSRQQDQNELLDQAVMELYDVPSNNQKIGFHPNNNVSGFKNLCLEDYDVPRFPSNDSGIGDGKLDNIYDIPKDCDVYDVPNKTPVPVHVQHRQGRIHGLQAQGKVDPLAIYDIPPQVTRDSAISMHSDGSSSAPSMDDSHGNTNNHRLSRCSMDSRESDKSLPQYDELPVSLDGALELLLQRQQDIESSSAKFLGLANDCVWSCREQLEPKLYDIKLSCMSVRTAMQELVDFGQGTLANSRQNQDSKLTKKLYGYLDSLQNSYRTVCQCMKSLDSHKWQLCQLSKGGDSIQEMDRMVAIVKDLPHIAGTLALFIQEHANLFFRSTKTLPSCDSNASIGSSCSSSSTKDIPVYSKVNKPMLRPKPGTVVQKVEKRSSVQDRPLPALPGQQTTTKPGQEPPTTESTTCTTAGTSEEGLYDVPNGPVADTSKGNQWMQDDYVALESPKNSPATIRRATGVKPPPDTGQKPPQQITPKFKERLEMVQSKILQESKPKESREGHPKADGRSSAELMNNNDRQILRFYHPHTEAYSCLLVNAIDAFFSCIKENQSPKDFISHSREVIIAAHRLVYVGDTINRHVIRQDIRSKVYMCASALCDSLKTCVVATKHAALTYPCVLATQDMLDRVVDVSHSANELKLVILQAATL